MNKKLYWLLVVLLLAWIAPCHAADEAYPAKPIHILVGFAAGGTTALHSALASCSPGVVVVNIDNGFGAACAALKLTRVFAPA